MKPMDLKAGEVDARATAPSERVGADDDPGGFQRDPVSARRLRAGAITGPLRPADQATQVASYPHAERGTGAGDPEWSVPLSGDLIEGGMQVLERLGGGSQGEIFRARDCIRERFVALKVAHDSDPWDARDVLMREMFPLQVLLHPHLVRLEGSHFGTHVGYLALELLDPTPLSVRIAHGTIAPRDAVRMVADVGDALAALHASGWVHRDVKAENVLFGRRGRAVLTDLGLAGCEGTLLDGRRSLPGTPSYMAPEVVRGEVDTVARWKAVDQYALGITAYLALTGTLPFEERGVYALMYAHLVQDPVLPSARRADLQRFDAPLLRALAKEPEERFENVGDFSRALRRALGD